MMRLSSITSHLTWRRPDAKNIKKHQKTTITLSDSFLLLLRSFLHGNLSGRLAGEKYPPQLQGVAWPGSHCFSDFCAQERAPWLVHLWEASNARRLPNWCRLHRLRSTALDCLQGICPVPFSRFWSQDETKIGIQWNHMLSDDIGFNKLKLLCSHSNSTLSACNSRCGPAGQWLRHLCLHRLKGSQACWKSGRNSFVWK